MIAWPLKLHIPRSRDARNPLPQAPLWDAGFPPLMLQMRPTGTAACDLTPSLLNCHLHLNRPIA